MEDQANHLRSLVRHQSRSADPPPPGARHPAARLIAVAGGKGGVGTTTVAIHLATALARSGARTVLVDADPGGGNIAVLCGLEPARSLADVVAGRREIGSVLCPGPADVAVAPGPFGTANFVEEAHCGVERLLAALEALRERFDCIVVDSGTGVHRSARRIWRRADVVLAVTTIELASVLDTYGAIKMLTASASPARIHVLVNRALHAAAAEDVFARLERACARFLAVGFEPAGYLPSEPALAAGPHGDRLEPLGEGSPAAERFCRLAAQLAMSRAGRAGDGRDPAADRVAACG